MNKNQIIIRPEIETDCGVIYQIHSETFKQENESKLIDILRETSEYNPKLSLIALIDNKPVGHILFYPLGIKTDKGFVVSLGLVPLAVKPEYQNQGIGSKLVKEGLKKAKDLGYKSIVVVGDPNYYGRFGFKPVKDISNNIGVNPDHCMFIELEKDNLFGIKGTIIYPEVFKKL